MDITSQITPVDHAPDRASAGTSAEAPGRAPMTTSGDTFGRAPCQTPDSSSHPNRDALDNLAQELTARSTSPKRLGILGEAYAAAWLERLGWRVVERNWGTRFGELDVIALDPTRTLVFVEVKTRRTQIFGPPQLAVGARKQTNLRRAASLWLRESAHAIRRSGLRFDVLAIVVASPYPRVQHIVGAF